MAERRIELVDVFGRAPLTGNPLAVVVDSDGLSDEEMLEITQWMGFSETTFLTEPVDPMADYKVRIFTLRGELPFAGHPTLGTCHVWRTIAGSTDDEIVQECGVGLVPLRVEDPLYFFRAPDQIKDGPIDEETFAMILDVLGVGADRVVSSRWVDNGPGWSGVLMETAGEVLDLQPSFDRNSAHLDIGVVGFYPESSETLYEVRAFFSNDQGALLEDPVTGSLNASVAQWLISEGRVEAPYVASQGTAIGRHGRVHVTGDGGDVWVGGQVFDVVEGQTGLFINGRR